MLLCGCRERYLPPDRFIQMGRSLRGAFPGAAEAPIFFIFPSCLMMGGWQPPETAPETGLSQEAKQSRASPDTRRPCKLLAARKDGQHGTAHWRGRPSGNSAAKRGSIPPRSKRDGSPWGLGCDPADNAAKRKTG